jgi:drug/metabolite transporter (DMT)-like permease
LLAALVLFLATPIWGASFLAMKALGLLQEKHLAATGTWFITSLSVFLRFAISALVLGLWKGSTVRKANRLEWWQGGGLGFFCGLGILFQMDGVQHTAASTSAFLTQCYCILVPATHALHSRKLPGKSLGLGCFLVMVGMFILSGVNLSHLQLGRGELESILGALLFTGQILWLERPLFRENRSLVVSFVMFAVIALLVLPVLLFSGGSWSQAQAFVNNGPALWLIGFLTFGSTLGAYCIMNYWQPHLPATEAGLIYCCEPLFTSLFALFLPGWLSVAFNLHYVNEVLTARLLVGGGLITAANLLVILTIPQPSTPPPATVRN